MRENPMRADVIARDRLKSAIAEKRASDTAKCHDLKDECFQLLGILAGELAKTGESLDRGSAREPAQRTRRQLSVIHSSLIDAVARLQGTGSAEVAERYDIRGGE